MSSDDSTKTNNEIIYTRIKDKIDSSIRQYKPLSSKQPLDIAMTLEEDSSEIEIGPEGARFYKPKCVRSQSNSTYIGLGSRSNSAYGSNRSNFGGTQSVYGGPGSYYDGSRSVYDGPRSLYGGPRSLHGGYSQSQYEGRRDRRIRDTSPMSVRSISRRFRDTSPISLHSIRSVDPSDTKSLKAYFDKTVLIQEILQEKIERAKFIKPPKRRKRHLKDSERDSEQNTEESSDDGKYSTRSECPIRYNKFTKQNVMHPYTQKEHGFSKIHSSHNQIRLQRSIFQPLVANSTFQLKSKPPVPEVDLRNLTCTATIEDKPEDNSQNANKENMTEKHNKIENVIEKHNKAENMTEKQKNNKAQKQNISHTDKEHIFLKPTVVSTRTSDTVELPICPPPVKVIPNNKQIVNKVITHTSRLSDVSEVPEISESICNDSMRPSFIKRKLFTQSLDVAAEKDANDDSRSESPVLNVYSSVPRPKPNQTKSTGTQGIVKRNILNNVAVEDKLKDLIGQLVPEQDLNLTTQMLHKNKARSSIHVEKSVQSVPERNKTNSTKNLNGTSISINNNDNTEVNKPNTEFIKQGNNKIISNNINEINSNSDKYDNKVKDKAEKQKHSTLKAITRSVSSPIKMDKKSGQTMKNTPRKSTKAEKNKIIAQATVVQVHNDLKGSNESILVKQANTDTQRAKRSLSNQPNKASKVPKLHLEKIQSVEKTKSGLMNSPLTEPNGQELSDSDDNEISFKFDQHEQNNTQSTENSIRRSTRRSMKPRRYLEFSFESSPAAPTRSKSEGGTGNGETERPISPTFTASDLGSPRPVVDNKHVSKLKNQERVLRRSPRINKNENQLQGSTAEPKVNKQRLSFGTKAKVQTEHQNKDDAKSNAKRSYDSFLDDTASDEYTRTSTKKSRSQTASVKDNVTVPNLDRITSEVSNRKEDIIHPFYPLKKISSGGVRESPRIASRKVANTQRSLSAPDKPEHSSARAVDSFLDDSSDDDARVKHSADRQASEVCKRREDNARSPVRPAPPLKKVNSGAVRESPRIASRKHASTHRSVSAPNKPGFSSSRAVDSFLDDTSDDDARVTHNVVALPKVQNTKNVPKEKSAPNNVFKEPLAFSRAPVSKKTVSDWKIGTSRVAKNNVTASINQSVAGRKNNANRSKLPSDIIELLGSAWEGDTDEETTGNIRRDVDKLRYKTRLSPARSDISVRSELVLPSSMAVRAGNSFKSRDVTKYDSYEAGLGMYRGMSSTHKQIIGVHRGMNSTRNASRFDDNVSVVSANSFRSLRSVGNKSNYSFVHFK